MILLIFSLLLLTLCGCGPCAVLLLICSVGLHFGSLKFLNVLNNIYASTLYHLNVFKQLLGFIFLLLELLLLNLVAQVRFNLLFAAHLNFSRVWLQHLGESSLLLEIDVPLCQLFHF